MKNKFMNESSFSRLTKRMGKWCSNTENDKKGLKDIVTISASRYKLINILNNDKILKNRKYIIGKDEWDVEAITQDLIKEGNVLIDKELEVKYDDELKKIAIRSTTEYTYKELEKRNKELQEKLRDKGYDVTRIKGSYLENGLPEEAESSEKSFFVTNSINDPNFLLEIAKLSEYYNQDSFMIKAAEDDEAFLIGTNDNNNPAYHELKNIGKLKINREIKSDKRGKDYSRLGKDKFAFQNENKYNIINILKESIMDTGKLDKYDLEELGIYEDVNDFPFFNGSWQHILHKNTITNGISYKTLEEEFDNDVDLWLEYNKKSNNKGCWNCIDCMNCIECEDCVECDTCVFCHDCYKCEKCLDCFHCQRCKHCCNLDTDVRQEYLGMKYEDEMEDDDGSGEWLYYFNFDEADKYYESRKTTATGKLLMESKDVNYEIVLDALEDYFTTNKNFYTDNRSYTTSDLINKYGISKSLDKVEGWEDVENLSIEYGLNKDDKESVKSIVNNYEKKLKKQVLKKL